VNISIGYCDDWWLCFIGSEKNNEIIILFSYYTHAKNKKPIRQSQETLSSTTRTSVWTCVDVSVYSDCHLFWQSISHGMGAANFISYSITIRAQLNF